MNKIAIAAAILAAGTTFGTAATAAEAARQVNVRSGPGTSYRIVDALYPGEHVNVQKCRSNGWCYVTHPGPDGWVSARYLLDDTGDDDVYHRNPDISFSFTIGGFGHGRHGGHGGHGGNDGGSNEELVCLVTFYEPGQVSAGADADVESARLLPRSVAERRDGPNDRRAIFDYGSDEQTRDTCEYLDELND